MCAGLCWLSFLLYYERRSHHKNVVKKDWEEIFIMCFAYTHSSTHRDYDTMQVRVCAISDRTSDVAFDWAFDRRMTDGTHHYHQPFLTFSFSTMIALHKSYKRMKNDDDHCPPLTFLQGWGNLCTLIHIYIRANRNS